MNASDFGVSGSSLQKVFNNFKEISNPNDFVEVALQFQHLMMLYEGVIQQIKTKLEILDNEFLVKSNRNPIESVKTRIKSPMSIADKLQSKGYELSIPSMVQNLNDIAGIRVICPFISDIYAVLDMLVSQDDITLISKKDYIKNPKKNGYRSLHLVLEVPVFLSDRKQSVKVEVQIRTIAMNFWASLEHQLRYKSENDVPPNISQDLKDCAIIIADTDMKMQQIAIQLQSL